MNLAKILTVIYIYIYIFILQVQIQVARCTHTSRAFCNCGVAALAGQDVFYIDYCNGADGIPVDYKSCGDNVLEVKSITELKYEVNIQEIAFDSAKVIHLTKFLIGHLTFLR